MATALQVLEPGTIEAVDIKTFSGQNDYLGPWKPTDRDRINIIRERVGATGSEALACRVERIRLPVPSDAPTGTQPEIEFHLVLVPKTGRFTHLLSEAQGYFGYPCVARFVNGLNFYFYIDEVSVGGDAFDSTLRTNFLITGRRNNQPVDWETIFYAAAQGSNTQGSIHQVRNMYLITNPGRSDSDGWVQDTEAQIPGNLGSTDSIIDVARGAGSERIRHGTVRVLEREFIPRTLDPFGETLEAARETLILQADIGSELVPQNVSVNELVEAELTIRRNDVYTIRRASFQVNNQILLEAEREAGI